MNFKITSIAIAGLMIASGLIIFNTSSQNNQAKVEPLPAHILTTTPTYSLSFNQNRNFTTDGIGSWANISGGWELVPANGTYESAGSSGLEIAADTTNYFYDGFVTFDLMTSRNTVWGIDSGFVGVYLRYSGSEGATKTGYDIGISTSHYVHPYDYLGVFIQKYVNNVRQASWSSSGCAIGYDYPSIVHSANNLGLWNNTWMRVTVGAVGPNIMVTWQNLSGNMSQCWRVSVQDIQTSYPITSGFIGIRAYRTNVKVRQVLYDCPNIQIPIREEQSIQIAMKSNYSSPVFSGTPGIGSFASPTWSIVAVRDLKGVYNQTFIMTSGGTTVSKQILLAVFPDFSAYSNWYYANPVIECTSSVPLSSQLYDPSVIQDTDGYYKMWLSSADPGGLKVHFFRSIDGISWINGASSNTTNIPYSYEKPAVVKIGAEYDMLIGHFNRSGIYWFKSTDGLNWTIQNGGFALLTPSYPWEDGVYQSPAIAIYNGTIYVTYAVSYEPGIGSAEPRLWGYASGPSFVSLVKYPTWLRLTDFASNGNVSLAFGSIKPIHYKNGWIAIINGFDAATLSHASLAMSSDFNNWVIYPGAQAFPTGTQSWASTYLYTGALFVNGYDDIGLWLNGKGTKEQIGFISYIGPERGQIYTSNNQVTSSRIYYNATAFGKAGIIGFNVSVNSIGSIWIDVEHWNLNVSRDGSIAGSWFATNASGGTATTYHISGLLYTVGYKVFRDGVEIYRQNSGLGGFTFTAIGNSTYELVVWSPWQNLSDMAGWILAIGFITGISAIIIVAIGSRIRRG